ncbi:MAG: hypothetical protein J6C42_09615, partial [Clostridia bacterium]|nr:hypothetical protein [Clostridia bacterium]
MLDNTKITEIHVAVNGSDVTGNGSMEHPCATAAAAQAAVRDMLRNGGLTQDVSICFHEGTYYQKEPITIGTSDCDSYYTITYTNFNSENVRIVGGLPVTGWSDPDGNG